MRKFPYDFSRRLFVLGACLLAGGLTGGVPQAAAQEHSVYPSKPITVVVGWNAGGGADIFARVVARHAEKHLGAPLVIVNKPGGGGQIALNEFVSRVDPDGYTIAVATAPNMIYQPQLRPEGQSGYQTEELMQIATPVRVPSGLMVRQDSDFQTFDDLIEYAKENPGQVLMGMMGARSSSHAFLLMVERITGAQFTPVNYPGGAEQVNAILGGEIHVLNSNAMHQVSYSDQLRPLGFAGDSRYPLTPDAPTFREMGFDLIDYATRGLVAPPGTPVEILEHLREGMARMAEDPDFEADLERSGLAIDFMSAQDVEVYLEEFAVNNAWVFDIFRSVD